MAIKLRTHQDRLADALANPHRAEDERSYRRGYLHGYNRALDDLQAGCRRSVWQRVCAFVDGPLMHWRYADVGTTFLPPACGQTEKG